MKRISIISAIIIVFSSSVFASQKPATPKWAKLWDKIQIDIPAQRSLDSIFLDPNSDFFSVDGYLEDANYGVNSDIAGGQTVLIYKIKEETSFKEVAAFIRSQNSKFIDPAALFFVWDKKHNRINHNRWLVGLSDPTASPVDLDRPLTMIRNWDYFSEDGIERFVFDTGEIESFPKNSYLAIIK